MYKIVRYVLLLGIGGISFLFASSISAEQLSKGAVEKLIERIDTAISAQDAAGVGNEFSDNVSITIHTDLMGQKQTLTLNKEEYIFMLEQQWMLVTSYQYSRSNMKISINRERALVTADLLESMTVQGQEFSGQSKTESVIEMVGGKPLVTKIIAYTSTKLL